MKSFFNELQNIFNKTRLMNNYNMKTYCFIILMCFLIISKGQIVTKRTPLDRYIFKGMINQIELMFVGGNCADLFCVKNDKDTFNIDSCKINLCVINEKIIRLKFVNKNTLTCVDTISFKIVDLPCPRVFLKNIREGEVGYDLSYSNFDTLRVEFPQYVQITNARIEIIAFDWAIHYKSKEIIKHNLGNSFQDFYKEYKEIQRGDKIYIDKVYLTIDGIHNEFEVKKIYKF